MSQQEFERMDEEVMGLVNRTTPKEHESCKQGDAVTCAAGCDDTEGSVDCCDNAKDAELRRGILLLTLQVIACVLVAAMFVAALMDPGFIVHLANIGVLACGIVAAIIIDRRFRRK